MDATDAMFHLDAVAHSVPEPVFPPENLNSHVSGILRATRPFLDTDHDWILPNIEDLQQQVSVYDTLLDRIDAIRSKCPFAVFPGTFFDPCFTEMQISQWQNANKPKPSWWHEEDRVVLVFSQVPWVLCHVCGAWRDIVISYPQLWSHIALNFTVPSPFKVPALASTVVSYPLEIMFKLDYNSDEDMAVQALSVIVKESYRWRTLRLCTSLKVLERLNVVRGKIPCLESCTLTALDMPETGRLGAGVPEGTRFIFAEAPRLQKVTLCGTRGLRDFIFPPRITHLAAYARNISNLGIYLSLVECHLMVHRTDDQDISPPPLHISLPNVRCLFVTSLRVLAHLCLPSLNNLTVHRINSDPTSDANPRDVQIVNDFIRRSRCSLSRLVFRSSNTDDQIFIRESFLFMDTLVFLEIFFLQGIQDTFNALAPVGFLPNLQHLRLYCFDIPSSQESLIAMVSSHSQNLRSIKIYCSKPEDAESFNRHIARLQQPGQHFIATQKRLDQNPFGTQSHFGIFSQPDLYVPVDK
ncbi:uncharacterized protein EV420DRAFT_1644289 [Desarmillaria tabescens]|uniref:F-box domain-containing protein n=1 Tax=Armillaria tabescens TaxID=1929756 RepID=A0AA39KC67_ARMTA|nr:uncharacterized protein EV420DRAFT_1644289 [Desarmillaria tabescens]KAK0457134.1 hypothetical protein EV420DRAFT_1644289 [Desarmillaria tabescens]